MILLHHPEVELSRDLLAALPEGCGCVDWTSEAQREEYASQCGIDPSAFPSIIVDVPAYAHDVPLLGADGEFLGMGRATMPATQEALRMPASWAAVDGYVDFVNQRAAENPPE